MFRAVYPSGSKFKYIASALVKITDEAPFFIKPDSLNVRVFSPDKTAMIIVKMPSIIFEEFQAEGEDYFVVASSDLNRVMKRGSRTDVLVLELDKSTGVLKTIFRNKKTGVERTFYVELKQSIPEEVPDLDVELGVTVSMLTSDFKILLRDLKTVGEHAVFHYKNGKLYVSSSEQQKEYRAVLEEGSPIISISSTVDEAKATYSIDLLKLALRASPVSKNITFSFDNDKPMKIEFPLEGGGSITYWIVSRVE
ncbi:DNA polymerase sliding clamp [Thermogladius sp. 4427co]|uniref:DNA polymerase sliding clamp n=1 Tax=Thermogladius sp. 4427co TaxID=3450718 RepID=UPI003F78D381